ncbi:hypothetical protein [Lysobacter sp. D1-1-M9]|uniref:hypothetical protein n=1 Tax=Novilysobacter longmucuonensis TaxID=3098603 RepID=UPI002FC60FE9
MSRTIRVALTGLLLTSALGACRQPAPSDPELPPEPQAAHGDMRDAVQAPMARARAVQAAVDAAAQAREADVSTQ